MSGALAAADRLRVAVVEPLAGIGAAARDARAAQVALHEAEDIMEVMAATANLTIACEALQAAGKRAEASLRGTLAEIMSDIGCSEFETTGHTIGLRSSPVPVLITDAAALPPHLMMTPAPAPDRKAIASALKNGAVPGAIHGNRAPPIISIRTRTP